MRTALPLLVLATAAAVAQSPTVPSPRFAPPVRVRAGDTMLGEGRLFPSPVFHDVNGDGRLDIVVGDLRGRLTVALRTADAVPTYEKDVPVLGADGKPVDLQNW